VTSSASSSPPRSDIPLWPAGLAGGAGCAVLAILGALGRLTLPDAGLGALAVILLTALILARTTRLNREAARFAPVVGPDHSIPPYAELAEALPDPILVVSARENAAIGRRFIFANRAARNLLQLDGSEGKLLAAIRDPEVLEAVDEALFGAKDAETLYEMGGAQAQVFRAHARSLGLAADGSRLALLVFRDETEARRMDRTRADFLANASHELRTPLASLSGFIETLRGHARDDAAARDRFLTIMQAQAERMSRLIDDLMSLSRIELNEHIPPAGEVDLAGAVADVLDAVGPLAQECGVTLEPRLPGRGEAMVTGDRDQIVQVAQNLVDNAMKYSPRGGAVRVEVIPGLTAEAVRQGVNPDAARLSLLTPDRSDQLFGLLRVTDQGAGIDRTHLPRLAERFYRVEGQKSGERQGTGLGLAIVKHIANRHRGGLGVESAVGQGSSFSVYFPQVPAEEPADLRRETVI